MSGMKRWTEIKNICGEKCTIEFKEDTQTKDQHNNIVNITIRDHSGNILSRGTTYDEAYNDARDELNNKATESFIQFAESQIIK